MTKRYVLLLVLGLACFGIASNASAQSVRFRRFAATFCERDNGVDRIDAAALRNWSSSTKRVYCGIVGRSDEPKMYNGSATLSPGATCTLRRRHYNGNGGSVYNQQYTDHHGSYEEIGFYTNRTVSGGTYVWAIECSLPPFGRITKFEVEYGL